MSNHSHDRNVVHLSIITALSHSHQQQHHHYDSQKNAEHKTSPPHNPIDRQGRASNNCNSSKNRLSPLVEQLHGLTVNDCSIAPAVVDATAATAVPVDSPLTDKEADEDWDIESPNCPSLSSPESSTSSPSSWSPASCKSCTTYPSNVEASVNCSPRRISRSSAISSRARLRRSEIFNLPTCIVNDGTDERTPSPLQQLLGNGQEKDSSEGGRAHRWKEEEEREEAASFTVATTEERFVEDDEEEEEECEEEEYEEEVFQFTIPDGHHEQSQQLQGQAICDPSINLNIIDHSSSCRSDIPSSPSSSSLTAPLLSFPSTRSGISSSSSIPPSSPCQSKVPVHPTHLNSNGCKDLSASPPSPPSSQDQDSKRVSTSSPIVTGIRPGSSSAENNNCSNITPVGANPGKDYYPDTGSNYSAALALHGAHTPSAHIDNLTLTATTLPFRDSVSIFKEDPLSPSSCPSPPSSSSTLTGSVSLPLPTLAPSSSIPSSSSSSLALPCSCPLTLRESCTIISAASNTNSNNDTDSSPTDPITSTCSCITNLQFIAGATITTTSTTATIASATTTTVGASSTRPPSPEQTMARPISTAIPASPLIPTASSTSTSTSNSALSSVSFASSAISSCSPYSSSSSSQSPSACLSSKDPTLPLHSSSSSSLSRTSDPPSLTLLSTPPLSLSLSFSPPFSASLPSFDSPPPSSPPSSTSSSSLFSPPRSPFPSTTTSTSTSPSPSLSSSSSTSPAKADIKRSGGSPGHDAGSGSGSNKNITAITIDPNAGQSLSQFIPILTFAPIHIPSTVDSCPFPIASPSTAHLSSTFAPSPLSQTTTTAPTSAGESSAAAIFTTKSSSSSPSTAVAIPPLVLSKPQTIQLPEPFNYNQHTNNNNNNNNNNKNNNNNREKSVIYDNMARRQSCSDLPPTSIIIPPYSRSSSPPFVTKVSSHSKSVSTDMRSSVKSRLLRNWIGQNGQQEYKVLE
ncbi:hypothetical protein EDD21DRAFT_420098, partial [Dissophora ornata]